MKLNDILCEVLKYKPEMTLLFITDDKDYASSFANIFQELCSSNKQLQRIKEVKQKYLHL